VGLPGVQRGAVVCVARGASRVMAASRPTARLAEQFDQAEQRAGRLIESVAATLERLRVVQNRRANGVGLPGRLARHPPALAIKLEAALSRQAEQSFEQLRLCLEELEINVRNLQGAMSTFEDEAIFHTLGNEYWRKRLLLEAALVSDDGEVWDALALQWPRPAAMVATATRDEPCAAVGPS